MDPSSNSRARNSSAQNVQTQGQQPPRGTNSPFQASIQNQELQANHVLRENFPYNPSINDPFSAYIHTDNDPSFNHGWDASEPIQNYGTSSNTWNQNVLQSTSNLLTGQDFGLQSRNFDQTYSRAQPVDYDTFQPSNPALTTSSFDPAFVPYGSVPLPDNGNFDFPHQAFRTVTRPTDTISPQALQAYPAASFSRVQIPEPPLVCCHPDSVWKKCRRNRWR